MGSNAVETWETCGTTPSLFGPPPGRRDATVLSTKSKVEGQLTGQDASPIEAMTQPVVELTSPITPPNQTEEER